MKHIDYEKFSDDVWLLSEKIHSATAKNRIGYDNLYGIPRGGVNVALQLSKHLRIPLTSYIIPSTLIVDDLTDSGDTLSKYPNNDTAVLYIKQWSKVKPTYYVEEVDEWIEFFYEMTEVDIRENVTRILEYTKGDLEKSYELLLKGYFVYKALNFCEKKNEAEKEKDNVLGQSDIKQP